MPIYVRICEDDRDRISNGDTYIGHDEPFRVPKLRAFCDLLGLQYREPFTCAQYHEVLPARSNKGRYFGRLWTILHDDLVMPDVDDTRENEYGVYYTQKRPLTIAATEEAPGI